MGVYITEWGYISQGSIRELGEWEYISLNRGVLENGGIYHWAGEY